MKQIRVRTGLEILARESFPRFRGQRVGLVVHPASVDSRLRHAIDLFAAADHVRLVTVFGPEHGLLGEAQDLIGVGDDRDLLSGIRSVSLYGENVESLRPTAEQLAGLDVLVIDLQDVGSRYYTFPTTMLYCLQAAAKVGLRCLVLDRPNPLGGETIEGPTLRPRIRELHRGTSDCHSARLDRRGVGPVLQGRAADRCRIGNRSLRGLKARHGLGRDRLALGIAVAEHADGGYGVRVSGPMLDRGNQPLGRAGHDPAV